MSLAFVKTIKAMKSLEFLSLDVESLCRKHLEVLSSEVRGLPHLKLQRLELKSMKNWDVFVKYAGTDMKSLYIPHTGFYPNYSSFNSIENLYVGRIDIFGQYRCKTTHIARAFPRLRSLTFLNDLCWEFEMSWHSSSLPCRRCVCYVLSTPLL